jgi:methyl-accepting chemotaxis protein
VVANEVKELAKETARATEDIGKRIAAIQADTDGAVAAIGEITTVIKKVSDIQGTIASAVEEQSATTNEIARNINEAARGGSSITENVAEVAEVATATSQGAAASGTAAKDLGRLATTLLGLVRKD